MGVERIKRNLGIVTDDVVAWIKTVVFESEKSAMLMYWQKGKNWYIHTPDIGITVNAGNYCVITAHKLKTIIRTMIETDYCTLREFLYQAIFVPEGEERPPRDIIDIPDIIRHIDGFGTKSGDLGVVVEMGDKRTGGGQVIGAAWTRIIPDCGSIDAETPELVISLFPEYRKKGIGTKLMKSLFELLRQNGYKQTSLVVQTNNPAVRFYKWLGYKVLEERPDGHGHQDYLMLKDLI
jgi:GNAT superfamily N-acetyltransferase